MTEKEFRTELIKLVQKYSNENRVQIRTIDIYWYESLGTRDCIASVKVETHALSLDHQDE